MRLDLSEYDFDIGYITGKDNVEADALSRFHFNPNELKQVLAITRSMARKAVVSPNESENFQGIIKCPLVYEAVNPVEVKLLPKLIFHASEAALT